MSAKKSKKTVKKANKISQARAIVKKINGDLIDASFDAIETTVKTGKKWQKLTSKLLKKTEPLTKKQVEMVTETAETIKGQLENGTERLKTLVGYDPKMLENAKKMVTDHPVVEKAEELKDKVQSEVAKNKLVKKAEKMTSKLVGDLTQTVEDIKEKIEDYAEDAIDEVKERVGLDKKKPAKKTKKVAKKATAKKAPAKKAVVKKPVAKKVPAKKSTPAKAEPKVVTVPASDKKDDLKVIKGIGPKMEELLNTQGVTAYEQITKMTLKDMRQVLVNGGTLNTKIYDVSAWKKQAKEELVKAEPAN